MGVHRGATLIQHLADVIPNAERHRLDAIHDVEAERGSLLSSGTVRSWHHQALADAPTFAIIARSDDGIIEGIIDPARRFYVGVQWHPERTEAAATGLDVVRQLVHAARVAASMSRRKSPGRSPRTKIHCVRSPSLSGRKPLFFSESESVCTYARHASVRLSALLLADVI